MSKQKKFKVTFSGFAYVNASDAEEAKEFFDDGDYAYCEWDADAEEVDEFTVII
jgi:hypothetical protein